MSFAINRIIFIIWTPFSQRDYNRFGVDLLRKNGFDVGIFDFTPFLNPDGFAECTPSDRIEFNNLCIFHSKKEAVRAINQLTKQCFVISLIPYHYKTYSIYRAISRKGIPYSATFNINALPLPPLNKRGPDILHNVKSGNFLNFLYSKVPLQLLGVRSETLFVAGGMKSVRDNPLKTDATKVVWTHALDYDLFLDEKMTNTKPIGCEYAVFLDEYAPFHPDYVHLKQAPYVSPDGYFNALNRFFDNLEKKNIEVIVAAHPRSQYEKHAPYFGDRQVIKSKTIKLVRDAAFVVLHASTAINYAVLFDKPVVFITTNALMASLEGPWIDAMASELGKRVHNLDESVAIDMDSERFVNKEIYRTYKNNYIKRDGTPELPFWQIVADELKAMEI